MSGSDRRTFLKRAAGLVPAIAVGAQELSGADTEAATSGVAGGEAESASGNPLPTPTTLDREILQAVGEATLPAEALGEDGVRRVVAEFQGWLDEYEPVAELDHPYLNHELRYGPADPGPGWQAQLEALDAEALKRQGSSFVQLDVAARRSLLARQLRGDSLERLPNTSRARHVATAMLAYFYSSSEANDLCYRARIGRHECRGLDGMSARPQSLPEGRPPGSDDAGWAERAGAPEPGR